ncbi:GntR family transcriptional regulator [Pseudokineococcus basanitobsidens]|uniref:GntR family transcriptional regulator n=1 Tax=Pseudokineococcus basanitobsidens TaxID=1926649 RepID=A0ABU8RFT1_9ACTN
MPAPAAPSAPPFDVDRSSPTPLYFQLSQAMEAAISGGLLPPGTRLENEIALAHRYGLSRPTVRRAVQELVDKGMLVRKRGVGTQVVQSHVSRPVELTSLFDDLARTGGTPTTEVLELVREPAAPDVATALGLAEGEATTRVVRLRRTNGEPLALLTNHLPGRFSVTEGDLADHGLYQHLRAQGVHLRVAHQRIGARLASTREAALLDETPRAALLTMERTAFDDYGTAVEHGAHVYRASCYEFATTLVDR